MKLAVGAITLFAASSAFGQDIQPVFDLPDMARGQVISSTAKAQASRGYARRGGATERQISACAQKSRFRAEYGASHPKVRQLYALCRGIGR